MFFQESDNLHIHDINCQLFVNFSYWGRILYFDFFVCFFDALPSSVTNRVQIALLLWQYLALKQGILLVGSSQTFNCMFGCLVCQLVFYFFSASHVLIICSSILELYSEKYFSHFFALLSTII